MSQTGFIINNLLHFIFLCQSNLFFFMLKDRVHLCKIKHTFITSIFYYLNGRLSSFTVE